MAGSRRPSHAHDPSHIDTLTPTPLYRFLPPAMIRCNEYVPSVLRSRWG
jgi:hypothetical protein